ncbi:Polynucleotide adenylyltransferase region [Calothrix sp. PCC 6303]|nr:Polynucleotide adenylyltransferase region [Calothrix sp. PCC 6303]
MAKSAELATVKEFMSFPVRSIHPHNTVAEAQKVLLRYGHSGLTVVGDAGEVLGIISRRDLDIAAYHGFQDAAVESHMSTSVKFVTPDTTLAEVQILMIRYDIGRLPVVETQKLVGIITRSDILRYLSIQTNNQELQTPTLAELQSRLTPELGKLLIQAAQEAEKRGWHLYLVGGAVRDMLLAGEESGYLEIKDIDLVVDGFHAAADVGAGVELAKAIQEIYPDVHLDIHGAFQTAALSWQQNSELGKLLVDIATARTEFYPYPAANPEVEASSIRQDLYRRDFSVNAIAFRLTPPDSGKLLDFFAGLQDLQMRQMRVLHPNSFIEDPTRIYRGVRFAIRLGFKLEAQTENYIRYAISSGVYERTARENSKTPALQTRLKTELKLILSASYWEAALVLLNDLGALRCIHPQFQLHRDFLRKLRFLQRCLQRFDQKGKLVHWQIKLEAIILQLAPEYRLEVATNFQMSDDNIRCLSNLEDVEARIIAFFSIAQTDSQVVKLLRQYDLGTLILIGTGTTRLIRGQIWRYLTILQHIQAPLNGNDLKKMGYKPSPQFKEMIDNLLTATLDGVVVDFESAQNYVIQHYSNEMFE